MKVLARDPAPAELVMAITLQKGKVRSRSFLREKRAYDPGMAVLPVAVGVKVLGAEKKGTALEAGVVRDADAALTAEGASVGAACGAADYATERALAGGLVAENSHQGEISEIIDAPRGRRAPARGAS